MPRLRAPILVLVALGDLACANSRFGPSDISDAAVSDTTASDAATDVIDPCASGTIARYCATPPCMPETFGTVTGGVGGLAVHGGWVYWTTNQSVVRQPVTGGNADQEPIATSQSSPGAIAVDNDGIFWVNHGTGQVMSCPLPTVPPSPCTPRMVAGGPADLGNEQSNMALDAERVYWAAAGDPGGAFGAAKKGGPLITYGTDPNTQYVGVDTKNVYWLTNCAGTKRRDKAATQPSLDLPKVCTFGGGGLVVDDAAVYVAGNDRLLRVPLGSGMVSELVLAPGVTGLALDCSAVYWSQGLLDGGTALTRIPKSALHNDGTVNAADEEIVTTSGGGLTTTDSTGVYWAGSGGIFRLRRL